MSVSMTGDDETWWVIHCTIMAPQDPITLIHSLLLTLAPMFCHPAAAPASVYA